MKAASGVRAFALDEDCTALCLSDVLSLYALIFFALLLLGCEVVTFKAFFKSL